MVYPLKRITTGRLSRHSNAKAFLKTLAIVAMAGRVGNVGNVVAAEKKVRCLILYNIHTSEKLNVKYYSSGTYDPDTLSEATRLMRFHYINEIKPIDVEFLDLLCDIKDDLEKTKKYTSTRDTAPLRIINML